MKQPASDFIKLENDRVEIEIDEALSNRSWDLRFTPQLEKKYDDLDNNQRNKDVFFYGICAIIIYDLFLLNDWITRPEILSDAIVWRGIATIYSAVILWLIHRGLTPKRREFLLSSAVVVVSFSAGMIFFLTPSSVSTYDPFICSLIFIASNTLLPLRIAHAVWTSVIMIAIILLFVFNHSYIDQEAIPYIVSLFLGTAAFSLLACFRLERSSRQSYLLRLREELHSENAAHSAYIFQELSNIDSLTELPNRRAFESALNKSFAHEKLKNRPGLSVLMIDIDYFKAFNDSKGHLAGDECLRRVASIMKAQLRDSDFIARFGGEEFVVLLSRSDKALTERTCERLRKSVAEQAIQYELNGKVQSVTISIGAVVSSPISQQSPNEIINLADQALYNAKGNGRNCWVLSEVSL